MSQTPPSSLPLELLLLASELNLSTQRHCERGIWRRSSKPLASWLAPSLQRASRFLKGQAQHNKRKTLLVHPARKVAAIHHQQSASYKAGRIGRKKDRCPNQFFEFAVSLHRSAQQNLLAAGCPRDKFFAQRRAEVSRRDGVYANSVPRPLNRQGFRQRCYTCFAGAVRCHFIKRQE